MKEGGRGREGKGGEGRREGKGGIGRVNIPRSCGSSSSSNVTSRISSSASFSYSVSNSFLFFMYPRLSTKAICSSYKINK